MSSLTDKQERFCLEYVVDFNATDAARRAGYSEHSASEIGYENLRKPQLQQRVRELAKETAERVQITAESILEGLWGEAHQASSDSARVRAWELLGKHLALFTDRLEITEIPDAATVRDWINELERDANA